MPAQNLPADGLTHVPKPGTLVVDTHRGQVAEFRGVAGPYWSLRPVCGGAEWDAEPAHVRPAEPIERLRAEVARANARARGELL
ncbi:MULTISPECIES: hypothetical protein [Streptomyces]|uniref:hypothetical protein n=1 Tax=Streptomyces TaxID=1883 RepID=UPI002249252B|nr:hypothetical protein [Streptomyces sp. JHD 1]MCX2969352.1 hypothetical protein [Streptomyces sp. JHD 1]